MAVDCQPHQTIKQASTQRKRYKKYKTETYIVGQGGRAQTILGCAYAKGRVGAAARQEVRVVRLSSPDAVQAVAHRAGLSSPATTILYRGPVLLVCSADERAARTSRETPSVIVLGTRGEPSADWGG